MSAPDLANILRVPGRLSHSPTDLSTAYPHGGTALGAVGKATLRPIEPVFAVTGEEVGGAPVELISGGARWVLDVELREYDADALAVLFPFYAAGARGGPMLKFTANASGQRAGQVLGTALAVLLVFTPDSPDDHQFLLLRRAVPAIQETAALALRGNASGTFAARWYATPDSSWRVFDHGRRRELTL